MALELYSRAVMGCRKIANALKVMLSRIRLLAPHHTTIRQWVHRHGCSQLKQSVERAGDWVVIADATVDVGSIKCLAVIGVRMQKLRSKENMVLSHDDVTLLGLYPTESLTGEYVNKVLLEVGDKVGVIHTLVIDEGPDVKKGAQLYRKAHPDVKVIHDIKHKMALVMKRHLEDNSIWSNYVAALSQARKLLYQTNLAALKPPSQRTKARYMDIKELIEWPIRVRESKQSGQLDSIPDERYQQYFGWIEEYVDHLKTWSIMVATVNMICHETRTHGLSEGLYEHLMTFFVEAPLEDRMQLFVGECLEKVMEEVDKLAASDILICSSEVLESIFGKHKQVNSGKQGMTGNLLGMGAFIGGELSDESVKETMEGCCVKDAYNWVKEKVGETGTCIRQRLLPNKGTKFDRCTEASSAA